MFEVDHSNLPEGEEYRELRQFVNSMELRHAAESYGCQSITVVAGDYRDRQSEEVRQGYFIARKSSPDKPILLIAEKKEGKGEGLFKYQAVPGW